MSAQKGKDLLLKIDEDGDGNFTTIAGLRSRRIAFNAQVVDVTDSESAGRWRELLGTGDSLSGHLMVYEGLAANFRKIKVKADPGCPLCGDTPSITDLSSHENTTLAGCAVNG